MNPHTYIPSSFPDLEITILPHFPHLAFFAALTFLLEKSYSITNLKSYPSIPPIQLTNTMAPRRALTRRGSSRASNMSSSTSRTQRNTRSRQPPSRYNHDHNQTGMQTDDSATNRVEPKRSIPEYSHSPTSNTRTVRGKPASHYPTLLQPKRQMTTKYTQFPASLYTIF